MAVVLRPRALAAAASVGFAWLPRILYQNYLRNLPAYNIVVSSEDVSGPRDAPTRPENGEFWMPTSLPATIRFDLGEIKTVDSAGLVANLASAKCSGKFETSLDGVTYVALSSEDMPADNTPQLFIDSARSARFLRLTVQAGSAYSEMPKIGVIYLGNVLVMYKGLDLGFGPANLSRDTELNVALSRGGSFLGQTIRSAGVSCEPSFTNLDHLWYRSYFDPFAKASRGIPYFFAWNKQDFFREVIYGWHDQNIKPRYNQLTEVSVSWKMQGIGSE